MTSTTSLTSEAMSTSSLAASTLRASMEADNMDISAKVGSAGPPSESPELRLSRLSVDLYNEMSSASCWPGIPASMPPRPPRPGLKFSDIFVPLPLV